MNPLNQSLQFGINYEELVKMRCKFKLAREFSNRWLSISFKPIEPRTGYDTIVQKNLETASQLNVLIISLLFLGFKKYLWSSFLHCSSTSFPEFSNFSLTSFTQKSFSSPYISSFLKPSAQSSLITSNRGVSRWKIHFGFVFCDSKLWRNFR